MGDAVGRPALVKEPKERPQGLVVPTLGSNKQELLVDRPDLGVPSRLSGYMSHASDEQRDSF